MMTPNLPIDPVYEDRDFIGIAPAPLAKVIVIGVFVLAVVFGLMAACFGQTLPSVVPTTRPAPILWRSIAWPGMTDYLTNSAKLFPVSGNWTPVPNVFSLVSNPPTGSSQPVTVTPIIQQPMPCDRGYDDMADYAALTIPQIAPGQYSIQFSGGSVPITITAPPPPVTVNFVPSPSGVHQDLSAIVASYFKQGRSVTAADGQWYWLNTVIVTSPNLTFSGSGDATKIYRVNNPANYGNALFDGGAANLMLSDFSLDGRDANWPMLVHSNAAFANLEIARVNADRATFIQANAQGLWAHDCHLTHPTLAWNDHELFQDCIFEGIGRDGNEVLASGIGPMMLNCKFLDTGRGITWRGVDGGYVFGLTLDGICHLPNGNEGMNFENNGDAADNTVISRVNYRGCTGPAVEFANSAVHNVTVKHLQINPGCLPFHSYGTADDSGNAFSDWQGPTPATMPSVQGSPVVNILPVNNQ